MIYHILLKNDLIFVSKVAVDIPYPFGILRRCFACCEGVGSTGGNCRVGVMGGPSPQGQFLQWLIWCPKMMYYSI